MTLEKAVTIGCGAAGVASRVSVRQRARRNGHDGAVVWLTGLSGSGKSTLAFGLESILFEHGWQVAVLDGDALRSGLSRDLGFSGADRAENIRRAAHVAALLARNGVVVIAAFITPAAPDRRLARRVAEDAAVRFLEVYLDAPLGVCEARDPKGLYKRAHAGEIAEFTGVTAPYDIPERPDLIIDTVALSVDDALARLTQAVVPVACEGVGSAPGR
jgi:bifunctional enzyme CysN/CysC